MKTAVFKRLATALLACFTVSACSTPLCEGVAVGDAADGLEIRVAKGELKRIGGDFFGFNLESTEFQLSLWDKESRRVEPEVVEFLGRFKGAVYRFPGGTTANYYRWAEGSGDLKARKAARITDWTELPRIDFGIDEYADFVARVGGQPWYVLNLQGSLGKPAEVEVLAAEASALAKHARRQGVRMLRWELGNELDRAQDMWPFQKYLARARQVLAAVRAADPEARFVGMMADYDAQAARGITSSQYNKAVAAGLKDLGVDEYEQHLYYDGPPDGPYMPNRLRQLCRSIQDARDAGVPQRKLGFWVTEHARWPVAGDGRPWKTSWHQTADLGAAIGIADLLIALTQIPEVLGSAIHTLHGTGGPWPLFHRPAKGGGPLAPSVTLHAYDVLNQGLLPIVLPSRSYSSNKSAYGGGYGSRGAVMATPDRKQFSVWSVNREPGETTVTLVMPELAGRTFQARLSYVTAPRLSAHNYDDPQAVLPDHSTLQVSFDDAGKARYAVPALSVASLRMGAGDKP